MTAVLVVGMAVVDFVFEVETMPTLAEKYVASGAQVVGGGGAANAAVAIANLGGNAMIAGRVGNDMVGELIVSDLQSHEVDCSLLQRTTGARSSYSSVLIDAAGERLIVNYRGENLSDNAQPIRALADNTSIQPAAVLADTRWQNGVLESMKLARRLGIPGILDAEPPLDPEVLQLASHIAFSRQGLESLTGNSNLRQGLLQLAGEYNCWLCVTDGENGVYYLRGGEVCNVPAPAVAVVDTLGAGDVWHGAFAYALAAANTSVDWSAKTLDNSAGTTKDSDAEIEAIRFANATASITCSRSGGGRVSPSLAEVMDFLAQ